MAIFPSTPRQHHHSQHPQQAAGAGDGNGGVTPHVRKASSLLDIRKRVVAASASKQDPGASTTTTTAAAGINNNNSSSSNTSHATPSAWSRLKHGIAGHTSHHNSTQTRGAAAPSAMPATIARSVSPASLAPSTRSASSATTTHDALGRTSTDADGTTSALPLVPPSGGVQAFLRVRPPRSTNAQSTPNVQLLSTTDATMSAAGEAGASNMPRSTSTFNNLASLANAGAGGSGHSSTSAGPPTVYSFTEIFGGDASQADVFARTTLPLVRGILGELPDLEGKMENALIFAYGVSGGGKTHTVQGDAGGSGDPGILPRALDVVLNSVEGRQTESWLRPCRLSGVEMTPLEERAAVTAPIATAIPGSGVGSHSGSMSSNTRKTLASQELERHILGMKQDETCLSLSENHEYSVWVSYAEVYNEKIYDLLDSAPVLGPAPTSTSTRMSTSASVSGNLYTEAIADKRRPLALKADRHAGNGSKYVHGLREVRVRTPEEGRRLLHRGLVNRQVFATAANGVSSRSHAIFTVRVLRLPKGLKGDDMPLLAGSGAVGEHAGSGGIGLARLCIVDLAGSERTKNALTAGDRLKEAGNINKSLMVLGQCMETMRKNQEDRARGIKKLEIVPFRHTKLTELFQTFFTGDGRAALIAALNPHDTSFEENQAVLKFAALARQVVASPHPGGLGAHLQVLSSAGGGESGRGYQMPLRPRINRFGSAGSAGSTGASSGNMPRGTPMQQKNLPILPCLPEGDSTFISEHGIDLYEDDTRSELAERHCNDESRELEDNTREEGEEDDDDDDDDDDPDAFVEALLDEIRLLRRRVVELELSHEAALSNALGAQADAHEAELRTLEDGFEARLDEERTRAEWKTDRKIEILAEAHRAQLRAVQDEHQIQLAAARGYGGQEAASTLLKQQRTTGNLSGEADSEEDEQDADGSAADSSESAASDDENNTDEDIFTVPAPPKPPAALAPVSTSRTTQAQTQHLRRSTRSSVNGEQKGDCAALPPSKQTRRSTRVSAAAGMDENVDLSKSLRSSGTLR